MRSRTGKIAPGCQRLSCAMTVPHLFIKRSALFCQHARTGKVSLDESQLPGDAIIRRYPLLETDLLGKREAFFQQRPDRLCVSLDYKEQLRQLGKRMRNSPFVLQLPIDRQALFKQGARP